MNHLDFVEQLKREDDRFWCVHLTKYEYYMLIAKISLNKEITRKYKKKLSRKNRFTFKEKNIEWIKYTKRIGQFKKRK